MANKIPRVPVREQDPKVRATNFDEVCYGYNLQEAMLEATRCLHCKNPRCVTACPVNLQIPDFIAKVAEGDIAGAAEVIARDSSLPAVCGRVCPQETQCEGSCVLGVKSEPVAIGKLERFVGDFAAEQFATLTGAACGLPVETSASLHPSQPFGWAPPSDASEGGHGFSRATAAAPTVARASAAVRLPGDVTGAAPLSKAAEPIIATQVAIIGSGPAGLACASDLAKMGYDVTIFEALHKAGGVLEYGIPEFRLPKDKVLEPAIDAVKALGVKIETNVIVGRTVTIDKLMDEEGFEAVFIGTGAGLPKFMGIPGENYNGVFSANEFLTRNNLMKAYRSDYMTPIHAGRRVCVVGGGNVAMDAARTALRLGAEVHIVYRRTEVELPARREEVHHAKEEGIIFDLLTNPVEVLADDKGWVRALKCIRMELGDPDESGRRSPVAIPGSEFEIEADTVIMALGTSPNPLIARTTAGLDTTKRGCLVATEDGATTRKGVFAGGDAVTGAATVILAMGAGRTAAKAIDQYLKNK